VRLVSCLLALSLFAPAAVLAADPPSADLSIERFLKRDVFGTIKLSPGGEYLAATVPLEDRTSLVILRRSDLAKTGHVTLPAKSHIVDFDWVNPTRVLFSIGEKQGDLVQPRATGELFGVNADGSGQGQAIFGFRSRGAGSRLVAGQVIDDLRDSENEVLVSIANDGAFTQVDRMNVKTGKRITVASAPVRRAQFINDPRGVIRFAAGADSDNKTKTYYRPDDKSEWQLINDEAATESIVVPVGFSADGKTAYLSVEEKTGPNGIYAFDTGTRERKLVLRDDNVDPWQFLYSPLDGSLYGVVFMDGLPRTEYLAPDNEFAKLHASMSASFPGHGVLPLTFTADGKLGLFRVFSDRVASDFYLFDRNTRQAQFVASRAAWFKPEQLAQTKPVSLKARDGLPLEGYLTLPKGSDGKDLPLVIHPHGGPFGPFDSWGYNPELQILASRGYAVLQVNFRGSGNYGRAFTRAGYKQWGGTMQDDLTDATKWAIEQGIADPNRICIYGASYGGYASLMAVAKEPDLYACAIGNVGVYDMPAMFNSGDIPESLSGRNFLKEALGERSLESASPTRLADRIKVPVSLMAGREDFRAAPIHTELMEKALRELGKPVEMKIYEGEGHGNYLPENRLDFANRVIAFLDRHIGRVGKVEVGVPEKQP
jgi:dipeptidyl aminopeptidase/acylaminoacyl peptidase